MGKEISIQWKCKPNIYDGMERIGIFKKDV